MALLLLFGLCYHALNNELTTAAATKAAPDLNGAAHLLKASAYFSLVAAASIWWVFAKGVLAQGGVLRGSGKPG